MSNAYNLFGQPILVSETCCNCGVPFGLHKETYDQRKRDGKNFHCPNGHQQHYTETEETKLKRELEKEKQRRQWAENSRDIAQKDARRSERKARAYKGVTTKIKNRVKNGVCPCCNRTFQNVMRHMKTKHPRWKK